MQSLAAADDSQKPLRRAHLIGVGGAGMRSLAAVLHAQGWRLTGSDTDHHAARRAPRGLQHISVGHHRDNITSQIDLVVHSPAIAADNPELLAAEQAGIRIVSYPQMLASVSVGKLGLAVAGTHGKSTVTAMAAEILSAAGWDPAMICGATPIARQAGGRWGSGPHFLLEACEYREHFLHLAPTAAVVLNIEPDHFDSFPDDDSLTGAFTRFVNKIPAHGLLLLNSHCARANGLASKAGCRRVTFGLTADSDWRAKPLADELGCLSFRLFHRRQYVTDVLLRVPGVHNLKNALAAAALCSELGASAADIRRGMARFLGLHRRLETLSPCGPISRVDDYAHHPTAVTASLASIRGMFPGRRICLLFQPHQALRTTRLLDGFAASLHNADLLAIAPVFRAREAAAANDDHPCQRLAHAATRGDRQTLWNHDLNTLVDQFTRQLRPGDVLVTMGAGDIGKVCNDIGDRLRENYPVG